MFRWFSVVLDALTDVLNRFFTNRPRLLRVLVGIARRQRPISRAGGVIVVTRADFVREVLERDDDFSLGPLNARKFLTGDFVIALDAGPRYDAEKKLIFESFPADRIARLDLASEAAARRILAGATARRRIDLVALSEEVTAELAESFWGIPIASAKSEVLAAAPGNETLRLWLRKLASALASTGEGPFGVGEVARRCSVEYLAFMRSWVDAVRGGSGARGPLAQLARSAPDADTALRNASGILVVASAVITKAFTHAMQQLLLRPAERDYAIELARAGKREELACVLFEALRFNPVFPMLAREAPRATVLAAGTPYETAVPAGATLLVSPLAALFDPEAVPEPDRFLRRRSPRLNEKFRSAGDRYGVAEGGVDLLFGGGMHRCLGDEIGLSVLASMAAVVLGANPRLLSRRIRYDGAAAARFEVALS
jgi:cytochrome P450